jgi:hypothetical protein
MFGEKVADSYRPPTPYRTRRRSAARKEGTNAADLFSDVGIRRADFGLVSLWSPRRGQVGRQLLDVLHTRLRRLLRHLFRLIGEAPPKASNFGHR